MHTFMTRLLHQIRWYSHILNAEFFAPNLKERHPEPEPIMAEEERVKEYQSAGGYGMVLEGWNFFNVQQIAHVVAASGVIMDLGCGPGSILIAAAQAHPQKTFIGIDLSPTMIAHATAAARSQGIQNVSFICGDFTTLSFIKDHSVDAVISSGALHHLPTYDMLVQTFRAIRRVLVVSGRIYICDLLRPRSETAIAGMIAINRDRGSHIVLKEYADSLRAAFRSDDFLRCLKSVAFPHISVAVVRPYPAMIVIHSDTQPLREITKKHLCQLQQRLSPVGLLEVSAGTCMMAVGGALLSLAQFVRQIVLFHW